MEISLIILATCLGIAAIIHACAVLARANSTLQSQQNAHEQAMASLGLVQVVVEIDDELAQVIWRTKDTPALIN